MSKLLSDPLTKTTDTLSVYCHYNITELDSILLNLIQSEKKVTLERLVRVFPYPITTESRRRKLQRFLDLPELTIARSVPLIAPYRSIAFNSGAEHLKVTDVVGMVSSNAVQESIALWQLC